METHNLCIFFLEFVNLVEYSTFDHIQDWYPNIFNYEPIYPHIFKFGKLSHFKTQTQSLDIFRFTTISHS